MFCVLNIVNVILLQVTFVGRVLSIEPRTTDVGFQIDDGTGTVEVRRW